MISRRSKTSAYVLAVASVLGSAGAQGMTPSCAATAGVAPFRLDRRSATRLLVSEPRPKYPALARINYIRGDVSVELTVDCAGRVEQAHVVKGHPFLAAAALQAIKKWVYRPFVTKAGPAAFQTTVKVDFSLLESDFRHFPPQPERFLAQSVKPPRPPKQTAVNGKEPTARMRVLVSAKGFVVDSTALTGTTAQFEEAKEVVSHWKFKPARWGNLNVPWYTDVEVPVW